VSPEITKRLDALDEICRRFHVKRLDVFGSVAMGEDRPHESDIDFLVAFEPLAPAARADAYFGLLEPLEALFGRHVDLVLGPTLKNPYFRLSVESTRRLVYAA
jgi:uncharacterized protein